jgi:hypothetical protein
MSKPVPERLRDAAALFEKRNAEYGDNYRTMGPVLRAMFPSGLTIKTEEEWVRIFLLIVNVMKTTRYAKNFMRGGHEDSMNDQSVYAQMAAETDEEARENKHFPTESAPPETKGTLHPPGAVHSAHAGTAGTIESRRWLGGQEGKVTKNP